MIVTYLLYLFDYKPPLLLRKAQTWFLISSLPLWRRKWKSIFHLHLNLFIRNIPSAKIRHVPSAKIHNIPLFQTEVLSKPSCMFAIFLCCLHSYDHRRLIYPHRILHSSIILDLRAFFYPPPRLFTSSVSSSPTYSNPPAHRHLKKCGFSLVSFR